MSVTAPRTAERRERGGLRTLYDERAARPVKKNATKETRTCRPPVDSGKTPTPIAPRLPSMVRMPTAR